MSSGPVSSETGEQSRSRPLRKTRSDAGSIKFQARDEYALTWIGEQYSIRLDHLQWLLGRDPGRKAVHTNWISESAARDVVKRWKLGKWVQHSQLRAHEPFWVWPTRLGLQKVGLPYRYYAGEKTSLKELNHLYAINEIRLQMGEDGGAQWVSERQLLQGLVRDKGRDLLHRPDGEIHWEDGTVYAVEAELSAKKSFELEENLMELLRGEAYLRLKLAYGWRTARSRSEGIQSSYTRIWYFAPRTIRKRVQRVRARLIERGEMSEQEATRLVLRWYPLVEDEEELRREEQEDRQGFHQAQETIDLKHRDGDETQLF